MGIEDPDADVAEQQVPTGPEEAEELDAADLPLEADEADVAEQRTHVPDYEDDRSR
ncbi:hypothetical protein [Pseudonocardia sp. TRM90224]|uniref:hypothetical protein n=1 Tax=Pseudonocardia sp. TRM90224 TaxID=2812678 RepID=UPI001E28FDD4|nr:hypothetical protein [Pseudonocardia sp. TRM90224]